MNIRQMAIVGLVLFLATSMVTFGAMGNGYGEHIGLGAGAGIGIGLTEEEVGKIFVEAVFPTISRGVQRTAVAEGNLSMDTVETAQGSTGENSGDTNPQVADTQAQNVSTPEAVIATFDKPLVIIYHTHGTEAFYPLATGNFHTTAYEGSVRQVGAVMAAEFERLGIPVIHDRSLHSYPSFAQSYRRSLETVQYLMQQNPTAIFIIDLHRDAAAYMGNVGRTVIVNGETTATYSLVIGRGNENVDALRTYANRIHAQAEEMFPGFGGRNIEKPHRYNQFISDYHILLEVGNNKNTIQEAKNTATFLAQVINEVIREIKQ